MPIAIPNFVGGSPADGDVGAGITGVITNNLKRSGLFAPIDQAAFIERITDIDRAPQFASWKQHQRAGARHRPRDAAARRPPQGGLPPLGRRAPASSLPANYYVTAPEYWRRVVAHHLRPDL